MYHSHRRVCDEKKAKCFRMRIWMGVKEKQTETERRRKNDAQICIRRLDCSVLASLHTESEAYWLLLLLYNTQRVYFFPTYTRIALSLSPLVSSTLLFFNFFSPSNFNPFVILYMGFSRNSAALSRCDCVSLTQQQQQQQSRWAAACLLHSCAERVNEHRTEPNELWVCIHTEPSPSI